jgi:Zn-finger nucleic acid-binding protein
MPKKLTTEEFIQRAREIHGGKFDYSKINYINNKTKVTIICPEHGEFKQTPSDHLGGSNCPKCGIMARTKLRKHSINDFIKKAKQIHGDRYDYIKTEYVNAMTKVVILCPEHGEFRQRPSRHLSGDGCPKCGKTKKLTTKNFIEKAKKIHGEKYNYSKVEYKNSRTKVTIVCSEHGEFEQTPKSHLRGNGCSKCSGRYMDQEFFIQKAKQVHENKYDYSKVVYDNSQSKVIIICPEHGEFGQKPNSHLNGNGCPKCRGYGFNWLSYKEAKKYIQKYNIKSVEEYNKWWKKNEKWCQKMGIPKNPQYHYSKNK